MPEFECTYKPDKRQNILDSWPKTVSEISNKDWGWKFNHTLAELINNIFKEQKRKTPLF